MTPRWKIRRGRYFMGQEPLWFVYRINGTLTVVMATFRVWENALLYIDIQEAGA